MRLRREDGGAESEVEIIAREGSTVRVRIDGREVVALLERASGDSAIISFNGRRYRVFGAKIRDRILVACGPAAFEFQQIDQGRVRGARRLATPEVTAPMPGKVLKVVVSEGQEVEAGEPLVVIEAMKMETTLTAESPARVRRVLVTEGQMVDHGEVLVELAPLNSAPSPPESGPQAS